MCQHVFEAMILFYFHFAIICIDLTVFMEGYDFSEYGVFAIAIFM